MKRFTTIVLALSLCACATTYKPVPEGYTGPVATVADSGFSESSSRAQMFVLAEVDGKDIDESLRATRGASYGQGFLLSPRYVSRQVPIKTMKVKLQGSHTTAAPIEAMMSQLAGTFYSVEGLVDFTPVEGGKYVVKGELKKTGSSVWIEDTATNKPATEKVVGK